MPSLLLFGAGLMWFFLGQAGDAPVVSAGALVLLGFNVLLLLDAQARTDC